jgi:hypothetical protein
MLAKLRDEKRYLHRLAMAAKFETEPCKTDDSKRKWMAEPFKPLTAKLMARLQLRI